MITPLTLISTIGWLITGTAVRIYYHNSSTNGGAELISYSIGLFILEQLLSSKLSPSLRTLCWVPACLSTLLVCPYVVSQGVLYLMSWIFPMFSIVQVVSVVVYSVTLSRAGVSSLEEDGSCVQVGTVLVLGTALVGYGGTGVMLWQLFQLEGLTMLFYGYLCTLICGIIGIFLYSGISSKGIISEAATISLFSIFSARLAMHELLNLNRSTVPLPLYQEVAAGGDWTSHLYAYLTFDFITTTSLNLLTILSFSHIFLNESIPIFKTPSYSIWFLYFYIVTSLSGVNQVQYHCRFIQSLLAPIGYALYLYRSSSDEWGN